MAFTPVSPSAPQWHWSADAAPLSVCASERANTQSRLSSIDSSRLCETSHERAHQPITLVCPLCVVAVTLLHIACSTPHTHTHTHTHNTPLQSVEWNDSAKNAPSDFAEKTGHAPLQSIRRTSTHHPPSHIASRTLVFPTTLACTLAASKRSGASTTLKY